LTPQNPGGFCSRAFAKQEALGFDRPWVQSEATPDTPGVQALNARDAQRGSLSLAVKSNLSRCAGMSRMGGKRAFLAALEGPARNPVFALPLGIASAALS
jgi:hypothetical protein